MLGKDVDMPHVSNSYFSARALVNYPERRKQLPPTDHYKQRFLDATSRARIKVATSARWRGVRISQQLMHTGELRGPLVLLHAREQAPRRQDVQGLFAAAACVEINQTQVARLKFDFHTGRRTGSSAGTRATRGRGASTSTRSSPTRRSGRR